MEGRLSADEAQLVRLAADFADRHVAPNAARWELERKAPTETIAAAAGAGLAGVLVPVAMGGRGASHLAAVEVLEQLAGRCMAFAFALWVHNNVANAIARSGTEEQRQRYLPAMLRGERIGAFCLTEPAAGSDAAAITTMARRMGSDWELHGEKAWVTNGVCADVFAVYAQTDPSLGWRGIACFLVDGDAPGLRRGPAYTMMGSHAMGVAGVTLDHSRVPAANLLHEPGAGFKAAMQGINMARTFVGATCCGILEASLAAALAYGSKRHAFGKPILSQQGLQWKLADVATELEAAKLLTRHAALALDRGEKAITESAHAKKFATRAALGGIARCMGAMGAVGYSFESPLARHLANAQMAEYLDGTSEIQNIVISGALLKPYGIQAR